MFTCNCGTLISTKYLDHQEFRNEERYIVKSVPCFPCVTCGSLTISRNNRIKLKKIVDSLVLEGRHIANFDAAVYKDLIE